MNVDLVPVTRTVMFVGDYFTLMTTITLDDQNLRIEGESDYDFAVRVASAFMDKYYGFDVASVSNDIGVVDEDGVDVDDK